MAKTMSKDSQIILNMMRIQDEMQSIIDSEDDNDALVEDQGKINLLTFYIIKLFALRKNFSSKTKKSLAIFDDFKGKIVLDSLSFCFPMISNLEIVSFARSLSDDAAREELTNRYDVCIKESPKYEAE